MKTKVILAILIILSMLITSVGFADDPVAPPGFVLGGDDGAMVRKNISKTPLSETEEAAIAMMPFYVAAQSSDGTLLTDGIEYFDSNDALYDTRYYAKPLVSIYIDGIEHEEELGSGGGAGERDAYAALSLDDGLTWNRSNLSNSADLSSFTLKNGIPYPGDAHYMTFSVAGDRVLAAWLSKYCLGGGAAYTIADDLDDLGRDDLQLAYGIESEIYFQDLFGVAGSQGSVDYTLQGFPEMGEIPYSCVWAARGVLRAVDDQGVPVTEPTADDYHEIIWSKPERLTSGRRDANRLEVAGVPGAGFVMTWQEDPKGLRPGQGLGPGEGWSGAIVNQKTDLWYSYIDWDNFDLVDDDDDLTTVPAVDPYTTLSTYLEDEAPKVAVPFAIPIRLTDNDMCKYNGDSDDYCYYDFESNELANPGETPLCTDVVTWVSPGGGSVQVCQTDDGRVLWGRVGGSRPRINLQGRDSDGDGEADTAWVIMAYEETKALGDGEPVVEPPPEDEDDPIDLGKNIWYHSFDMFTPDIVSQGGMLNHPARCTPNDVAQGVEGCAEVGDDHLSIPVDFEGDEVAEIDTYVLQTEIARRFNLMTQPLGKVLDESGELKTSGTMGILMYKQGIINQGGPADIFLRRLVLPEEFDPAVDNPYAFENIACDNWVTTDGEGHDLYYVKPVCADTGINVSGTSIVSCDNGTTGSACAEAFPWESGTTTFPKVEVWRQCDDAASIEGCDTADDLDGTGDLDDESWENPYDVAKGHRGFIDGDFIMQMYAWSSNWKANSVGNDKYNLYIRRSFDGGVTWTTTPGNLGGDGTTTCENYLDESVGEEGTECFDYGANEFEQARNVSQLVGTKVTILDPRYSPTAASILDEPFWAEGKGYFFDQYPDDVRDPSIFFIVYETGDNTTVQEGEAVPMDLFYSRASMYGDIYEVTLPGDEGSWPTAPEPEDWVWDWLEHDREDLSGEAAIISNPGGLYFYSVWNQCKEDEHENVYDSDIIFRRTLHNDDLFELAPTAMILYVSTDKAEYDDPDVVLIGSGKDNDSLGEGEGIDNYRWQDDLTGQTFNERTWKFPPRGLIPGHHPFSFQVQDNEGRWSQPKSTTIWIAEQFYDNYLPLVTR